MILYLCLQLVPLAYGTLYFRHSIRRRRRGQAAAIGVLLLLTLSAAALLLWEFLSLP